MQSSNNMAQITWNSLTLGNLIGNGSFGDVYQSTWEGKAVAIKLLQMKTLAPHLADDFIREAKIMWKCQSDNTLGLIGICTEAGHYAMITEYMSNGSLYHVINNNNLTEAQYWQIALDIATGMQYLHSKDIIHRDLKSFNVLIDDNFKAKISDFGLAKLKNTTASSSSSNKKVVGSIRWRAPELLKRGAIANQASDIYSLGMVLWEIASKKLPFFDALDDVTVMGWLKDGEQEIIPDDCPEVWKNIIKACWADPNNRPSAADIVTQLDANMPKIEVKEELKSWHFATKPEASQLQSNCNLLKADKEDYQKVQACYSHHPVPGYEIASIEVIYNPKLNRSFSLKLDLLQQRHNKSAFAPRWQQENNPEWRKTIHDTWQQLAAPYQDSDYPNVSLLPLWHGTKPEILGSLFETGYANLATTDSGFFGKGLYSAYEAEYSHRVYSKGALILNWVCSYSAYPVIDGDMTKLSEKGNYANYDSHFIPVIPQNPNDPFEANYFPTRPNQKATYHEMVVFDNGQCLPRYLVTLQKTLLKSPAPKIPSAPFGVGPIPGQINPQQSVYGGQNKPKHLQQSASPNQSPSAGRGIPLGRGTAQLNSHQSVYGGQNKPKHLQQSASPNQSPSAGRGIPLGRGTAQLNSHQSVYGGQNKPKHLQQSASPNQSPSAGRGIPLGRGTAQSNPQQSLYGGQNKPKHLQQSASPNQSPSAGMGIPLGRGTAQLNQHQSVYGGQNKPKHLQQSASPNQSPSVGRGIPLGRGTAQLNPQQSVYGGSNKTSNTQQSASINLLVSVIKPEDLIEVLDLAIKDESKALDKINKDLHLSELFAGCNTTSQAHQTLKTFYPAYKGYLKQKLLDSNKNPCISTLEGHIVLVACVAVMQDGTIVSGSRDKTLKIWDKEGKCLLELKGHTNWVLCVAVMQDGTIVSGSYDKTLKIWDKEGNCLHTLEGHTGSVECVAVKQDGTIVSGSIDKTLKIWDKEGKCLHTLKGHTNWVLCVAVMQDGSIVSGSFDNTLKIWDKEGKCLHTLKGHTDWVNCVAVMQDGSIVSGSDDKTLKIWDKEGKCLLDLKGHTNSVTCVAVMQDGSIVSGSWDKTLKIWDKEGKCLHTLKGHTSSVYCVAVMQDGTIVSGSDDKTLKIWDKEGLGLLKEQVEELEQKAVACKIM